MSCSPYGSDAAHEYYAPSSPPDHAYTPTGGEEDFQIEYPPRAYDAARSAQSRTYHDTAGDYGKYDDEELNQRALWSPDQYGAEPRDGYYRDDRGSFEYSLDKDCIYGRDVDKKRRQQQFGARKDESSYDYSIDDDRPYNHSLDDDKYAYNSDREDYYEDKDVARRDHRGSVGDHRESIGDRRRSVGDRRGSTEDHLYDYDDDDKHLQHDRKQSDVMDPYDRDDRYRHDSVLGRHEYNGALESRDGYDSAYAYSTEKECGGGGGSWSDQHKESDRRESNTGYWLLIFRL